MSESVRALSSWSQLLTPKDVAEVLSVSLTTASGVMRKAGASNIGCGEKYQSLRITEEDLIKHLKSCIVRTNKSSTAYSTVSKEKKLKPKNTQAKNTADEGRRLPWNG